MASTHGRSVSRRHGAAGGANRRSHGSSFVGPPRAGDAYYGNGEVVLEHVPPGALPPGSVDSGIIQDGSFILSKFTQDIRPPVIVDSLPGLPDPNYPDFSTVVLTTNGKLYRNDGGVWTAAVPGVDIVDGSIVTEKLADLSVSLAKVGVLSIDVSKITDDAVTTPKLAALSVVATKIAAGAIETDKLAANSVVSGKIAAGAIETDKLAANSVTSVKVAAGAITAEKIAADTITAGQISAGAIGVSELAAGAVETDKLAAGAITAEKIAVGTITATEIAAGAIGVSELAAGAVRADKLDVGGGRYLTNPDFETGVEGWSFYGFGGTGGGLTRNGDNGLRPQGQWSGALASGSVVGGAYQDVAGVHANDYIQVGALVFAPYSGYFKVDWLDAAGNGISSHDGGMFSGVGAYGTTGMARQTAKLGPAPPLAATARIWVVNSIAFSSLYFDDVWLSRVGDLITPDGNTVINSSGITVTNGKIIVTNAGATVIIDGTSNHFKIAATGTMTVTRSTPGNSQSIIEVGGTGLSGSNSPAFLGFLAEGTSPVSNAHRSVGWFFKEATGYLAPISGASPVNPSKYMRWYGYVLSTTGGGNPRLELEVRSAETTTAALSLRYHLLREAGI